MLHVGSWSSRHVQQGASASQHQGSATVRTVTAMARKPRPLVGCSTVVRRPDCAQSRASGGRMSRWGPTWDALWTCDMQHRQRLRSSTRNVPFILSNRTMQSSECGRAHSRCQAQHHISHSPAIPRLASASSLPHLVLCETIQYLVQCPSAHLPLPPRFAAFVPCCAAPVCVMALRVDRRSDGEYRTGVAIRIA
jgi:hypothetical protein